MADESSSIIRKAQAINAETKSLQIEHKNVAKAAAAQAIAHQELATVAVDHDSATPAQHTDPSNLYVDISSSNYDDHEAASILRKDDVPKGKRRKPEPEVPPSEMILPVPLESSWRWSETYNATIKDDWKEMKWWRLTKEQAYNRTHFLNYEIIHPGSIADKSIHTLKASSHACVGNEEDGNQVCTFYDLVLWNDTFYYIAPQNFTLPVVRMSYVGIDPFLTHTFLTERMKVVSMPQFEQMIQYDEKDPSTSFGSVPKVRMHEVLLLYLSYYNNYGHLLGEAAPILHNTLCMYMGRCSYEDKDRADLQILLFNRDRETTNQMPRAIREELWPCYSQQPLLRANDRRLNHTAVVIDKMVAGVGAHCRGFPWCRPRYNKVPLLATMVSSWRKRITECTGLPAPSAADGTNPDIVLINRPLSHGRAYTNAVEVAKQLAIDFSNASIRVEELNSESLASQASKYMRADILIQMHGAALGNLVFLPTGAVYIDTVPKLNSDKHAWAEFMAQDFNQMQLTVIQLPELEVELMEDLITSRNAWRKLSLQEKEMVLKQHTCPKPGQTKLLDVYQACVIDWFMKRSNCILDYQELKRAVETAVQLIDLGTERRRANPLADSLDMTYFRQDKDMLDIL